MSDPLHHAGTVTCRTCGHRGYPTDAVALTEDTVLATYASECGHNRPTTWLVDLFAPRRPQCWATTKAGRLCKIKPIGDTGLCFVHRDANANAPNDGMGEHVARDRE